MKFKNGLWHLYGDAREVIKEVPDKSIHVAVTSPPYFRLRNYGHKNQIGWEKTPKEYIANLMLVFKEVHRALRDDGVLWVNIDDTYNSKNKSLFGVPSLFEMAMREFGWIHRKTIIWYKRNGMAESITDRCTHKHEYVYMFTKSKKYFYDCYSLKEKSGARLISVWDIKVQPNLSSEHTAVFPDELVRRCLLTSTSKFGVCTVCQRPIDFSTYKVKKQNHKSVTYKGKTLKDYDSQKANNPANTKRRILDSLEYDILLKPNKLCKCKSSGNGSHIVLDPFGGSGTTGRVAKNLGNRAVLIDLRTY